MANNVNELYYFYGKKADVKNLYDLFSNEEFEVAGGYVTKLYELDSSETSFKVEIYGSWNSCSHSIAEELGNHSINVDFYMASYEESNLWCFTDDTESKFIKEDYVISYLPDEDYENSDNPVNRLTVKHYYTAEELKSIFDAFYNKNESIEFYLDYFKQVSGKDDYSCYETNPEKFAVRIEKLTRGSREENLLCTYDEELIDELSDPEDEYTETSMNSNLYVIAWLHKYGKSTRKISYYDIGLEWETCHDNKYKAFKWYFKGEQEGEIACLVKLGNAYLGEYGSEFFDEYELSDDDSNSMAADYFKQAVEQYNSDCSKYSYAQQCAGEAAGKLGEIANREESDKETANKWFEQAIELGFTECKLPYAINIFEGEGTEENPEKAIAILKDSLENDLLLEPERTAYYLALMYENTECFDEACEYFKNAAESGYNKAIKWLVNHEDVENNNDFSSLKNINMEYKDSVDFDKGSELLEEYEEETDEEAFKLLKKAFDKGVLQACLALGLCYEDGRGVEEDYEKAAECYAIGAFNDDESCKFKLAQCYENGTGVEQNWGMAYKWYSEAFDDGLEEAEEWLSDKGFIED